MKVRTRYSAAGLVCLLLPFLSGAGSSGSNFPPAESLPPRLGLPDPLVMLNGKPVGSKAEWFKERRPELKTLFQHYMYGLLPPKPARMDTRVLGEYSDFLGGKARLKLLRLETGRETNAPRIDLMLIVPTEGTKPAPVFLAMDFCGNQALSDDPRIPLPATWMSKGCPGCSNNAATEESRGTQSANWPLDEIVRRGYALATFYSGDIDSDRPDVSSGVYAWAAHGDSSKNNPTNRGTISAWAWGFQRCVDYLVTDSAIDSHKIAVLGHSRNGKTALLAAALDERIAMAFPHQAGCGGSAPSRGKTGESVKAINEHFPYWFNAEFKKFNNAPERLPFDQNCLLALCAPRPVLFSAAEGDQWSNPAGQFGILKAADPVYRFLGAEGLTTTNMPPLNKLVDTRLGYFIRPGKHSMLVGDWHAFLDFADKHFKAHDNK